ncbi:MAG: internal scaffolding protein [Arizlama microvirus]|nr:MAG: internal scaffolding protein [Arizlama microvirus]
MSKAPLRYGHWRPHKRVQEDGAIVTQLGEVTYPPSRTKQSHLAECDINNIVKQFSVTGMVTHINAKAMQGAYVDLPDELDFQAAQNTVIEGQKAFATLPAKVRERFGNEPAGFLAFMSDEKNRPEAIELGLLPRPPAAPPEAAKAPSKE